MGDGAPATPPSGYAPEQKSGPQEVGLTAEGDNDALAGPFLVECPPCASTYSPGAPQSNGSPACAVVSRLMSTHARVGEAISGGIGLIARRFTILQTSTFPGASRLNEVAPDHASRSRYREETNRVRQHIDLTDAQPSRCLR